MTEKKFLAALAVATVGLNLILAGGVAAKPSHCAKDCKQDIKNCLTLVPPNKNCTGTKAEKKACRKNYATQRKACHGLVKLCKQQNPSMSGACLLSSTTTTSTTTPTTSPLPANTTTTTTTPTVTTCPILSEDFESGVLDPRISVQTVGTFNVPAGIQNVTDFGSSKAFGFGLSTCAVNCFLNFLTTLHINFDQPTLITTISFDEKEQFDNWGSEGRVFIDGTPLGTGEGGLGFDFGRVPVNDRHADTTFRSHVF